jgi:phosphatidate phosphatase LPIN
MDYVEKVLDGVHGVLNLNAATLSGAIDIVVVPREDQFHSTPFHVRFGKMQLLNSYEKMVTRVQTKLQYYRSQSLSMMKLCQISK